ncbi:GntR family transcriptional regulator [Carbonactinospora thermoautotrophica]|nr:GntR family transcriptional regulator [Carbonactinospora thermoautotrophica]
MDIKRGEAYKGAMPKRNEGQGPVYLRIADDLHQQISSGVLAPRQQLPTESEIAERYQVSRHTVRQALDVLRNRGLIVSRRGRGLSGHYVKERHKVTYHATLSEDPQRRDSSQWDAWITDLREQGLEGSQRIEVAVQTASELIARELEIDEGAPVAVRRRLRFVNGDPDSTQTSYYPLEIVQGSEILIPTDIQRGASKVLAELGHRPVDHEDLIITRMPTPQEIEELRIGPGVPVFEHIRSSRDQSGRRVRAVVHILPGDRYEIRYTVGNKHE